MRTTLIRHAKALALFCALFALVGLFVWTVLNYGHAVGEVITAFVAVGMIACLYSVCLGAIK